MRSALQSLILASGIILMSLPLSGCFVAYIPGSVTGSIADSLTGEHGKFCVTAQTKPGDRLTLPSGQQGIVQSLSGSSIRCKDPARPVRADIG